MARSITYAIPSDTKTSSIGGARTNHLIIIIFVVTIAVTNWMASARILGSFHEPADYVHADAASGPTTAAGYDSNRSRWAHNITDYPAFMLQWPLDPFQPDECDIFNTSMPYVFTVTDYPRSYGLDDIFHVEHGNLSEAWDRVGITTNEGGRTNMTGKEQIPANEVKVALCTIGEQNVIWQFPHLMQNLVPCWSLWRHFPDAQHILNVGMPFKPRFFKTSAFSAGMFKVLRGSNITVVRRDHDQLIAEAKPAEGTLIVARAKMNLLSGYRAGHKDDMQHLRRSTLSVLGMDHYMGRSCGMTASSNGQGTSPTGSATNDESGTSGMSNANQSRTPRIAIINRMSRRRLKGAHNVSMLLQEELGLPYRPPVVFLENMRFALQVEIFANIDILLTPHGAQLTSLPFMPRCGSVIEVMPYGYDWNNYFGTLAAMSGVNHSFIYLGEDIAAETALFTTPVQHKERRSVLLCAPAHAMAETVRIQVDRWQECCGFAL